MPAARTLSTRVLLICAAIGVASGLLATVAGYLSPVVFAAAPVLYGLVLGSHVIPGVIAQSLLRLPWVALLTHLFAALVASAFAPQWIARYLGTALLIGALQEGVAALTRYRSWQTWRYFISALIVGAALAAVMGFALNAAALPTWAVITLYVVLLLGPVLWTWIGLRIGIALRNAGVARTVRR